MGESSGFVGAPAAAGNTALRRSIGLLAAFILYCNWLSPAPAAEAGKIVILSTTTSTQDSGLLDVLAPLFERQTPYDVKPVAVGTGQALALAGKGEADVTLVHAPALEKKYLREGKLQNRRPVMYNAFVILGPKEDPAGIAVVGKAADAFRLIARAQVPFVSRGDDSGTHHLELLLWTLAGDKPAGSSYLESGQGMGATLRIASERNAYTLTDRGTYLALRTRLRLPILLAGDKRLVNLYSVAEVNPANGSRVNATGGRAFAEFMVSAKTQTLIGSFGREKFGQPLFVPVAGKREEEIGE